MRKFFPLYLILIVALIWTVTGASSADKADNAIFTKQVRGEKAAKAQPAAVDEMTPEKAARIAESEAIKPMTIIEALGGKSERQITEYPDLSRLYETRIDPIQAQNARLARDKARLVEIKADGIVTAEERAEADRIASTFMGEPIPMPLNIVSESEPNDDCASADTIACGDTVWCATQTTGSDDHDWFVFTLDNSEPSWDVTIETHPTNGSCDPASSDTYLELWEMPCDSLIAYDDDGGFNFFSLITITLPPGTYAIHEDNTVWTSDGSYHLSVDCIPTPPPPANDLCDDAVTVSVPSSTAGTTISATVDSMDFCGTSNTAPGVWYKVTGTGNTITASTCDAGTNYDTKLQVWCNSCDVPICVTGNDDDFGCTYSSLQSTVTWCSEDGTDYLILVAGYDVDVGDFVLNISDDATPCNDPISCLPPEPCPGDSIVIDLQTDSYGYETSWDLMYSGTSIVVASGSGYSSNFSYSITVCTETDSCYDFHIYDSYGDGGAAWQVYFNGTLSCSGTFPTGYQEDCWAIGANCTMPYGMCCYGDPYDPTCVDTFAVDCASLSGVLDATKSCATDYCAPCDTVTAVPPNDSCHNVTPVVLTPDVPEIFTGNSCNSTIDCGLLAYPHVWEAFTTTITGDVSIELCGSNYNGEPWGDGYIVMYSDCPCVSGTYWDSYEFDCVDGNVRIFWNDLPAGTWYYPVIWNPEYDAGGDYVVTVTVFTPPPPPANDSCSAAITVAVPSDTPGSTSSATPDTMDCGTYQYAKSVWYKVIGTGNTITASLCDSNTNYDTKIQVWCNTCTDPMCVGGNDDDFNCTYDTYHSTYSWCSEQGVEYLILVGGFSTNRGDFVLHVSDDGTPCSTPPDCTPPIGRCCYNNDQDCADISADACAALGGYWNEFMNCTDNPCLCPTGQDKIVVNLTTDFFPSEITWEIYDRAVGLIAFGGPYPDANTNYIHEICVDQGGCYDWYIYDSFGDGGGPYDLYYAGNLVHSSDGSYGTGESVYDLGNIGCGDPTGACCVDAQCVATNLQIECDALSGSWYMYEDCADFECPPTACDTTSLFGQSPTDPDSNWILANSEIDLGSSGPGYLIFENFSGLTGDICDIHFWGARIDFGNLAPCFEDPMPFEFTFYADIAGIPDTANPICAHVDTIAGIATGLIYNTSIGPFEAFYYETVLDPCCTLTDGWISIGGVGDPDCWFYWVSSGNVGSGFAYQQTLVDGVLGVTDYDLSLCLTPTGGSGECDYIIGDVNGSNNYNGLDITYGVNFFKYGSPDPQCDPDCPPCAGWNYCGDVNASCNYNGLDITYGVNYFKYGSPAPDPCADCPPIGPSSDNPSPEIPQVIKSKTVNQKGIGLK
jgi:hypothetical protein